MERTVTKQEVIDQATFADEVDESGQEFESLTDFLDHVELEVGLS